MSRLCKVCREPATHHIEHRGTELHWCDEHVPLEVSEKWRPVVIAPAYQVSSLGRVRGPSGKILRPRPNKDGHLRVALSTPYGRRDWFVHQLVLHAFVGEPLPGQQCCHHDDDPTNNRLSNLRWDTARGNARDRKRNGRQGRCVGSANAAAKLDAQDAEQIRAAKRLGASTKALAHRFGVSERQVRNVVAGKHWSDDA